MNKILYITTSEIRDNLGLAYKEIKRYDLLKKYRKDTSSIKKSILKTHNKRCAACGEKENLINIKLEAAHLEALEECGITEENNIILLCKRKNPIIPGCHELFDMGYYSVSGMKKLRDIWKKGKYKNVRDGMFKRYKKPIKIKEISFVKKEIMKKIRECISKCQYRKATRIAEERLNLSRNTVEKFQLKIKIGELHRRRATKNSLDTGLKCINAISIKEIPKQLLSSYFYEVGYINMLRGDHISALDAFEKSRNYLDKKDKEYGAKWAAATSLIIQQNCQLIASGLKSLYSFKELEKLLDKSLLKAKNVNTTLGYRWVNNCMWHKARLKIAQQKFDEAKNLWRKAYINWQSMDVQTGWERGSRMFVSLQGIILANLAHNKEEAKEALRFLSRSLVVLIGGRRMYPETVRDILFNIALAIDKLNIKQKKQVELIKKIATYTRDGSSWFYPYFF
jgi:hypothetical protein